MASKKPNKWVEKLMKLEGAVDLSSGFDPHAVVVPTGSPSVNFTFGHGHGLPCGFSMLLYGYPKGGKSVICNSMIAELHRIDPEAIAVKFNTEFREKGQMTPAQLAQWGIDLDRYVPYEVNDPALIYDRIQTDIAAMCQDGAKIKLVIIDSINSIQGRRSMDDESVMTQQRGDEAMTNQVGLKRILPIQHKYGFGTVITAQVRAEQDPNKAMKSKVRPGVPFAVQHHCEYYMFVERNETKDGGKDLMGAALVDESVNANLSATNKEGAGDLTGHRIRVKMIDSSMGPKGRVGEFTFDYNKGIINQHEEIFLLGVARNIIEHPTSVTYAFGDRKWHGKADMVKALADESDLRRAIMDEVRARDLNGVLAPLPEDQEE